MARREIKYGNPLIIDVIREKYIDSNDDNNALNTVMTMYEEIPKLYEELEQMIQKEIINND